MLPEGPGAALALQWSFWAATELEPPIMQWAVNTFQAVEKERDTRLAAAGRVATEKRFAVLTAALEGRPYLLGESFCIADLAVAGVAYGSWFNGYDFSAQPVVKAWLERCLTRPAALRARRLRES